MDADELREVESLLLDRLRYHAEHGYWETVERISNTLLNFAALRAIEAGGRVRAARGGPVVDPPRKADAG